MSKIDPHASAFPVAGLRGFDRIEAYPEPGLAKREYFAALAMQGFAAYAGPLPEPGELFKCAAAYADALLAELDKEQK